MGLHYAGGAAQRCNVFFKCDACRRRRARGVPEFGFLGFRVYGLGLASDLPNLSAHASAGDVPDFLYPQNPLIEGQTLGSLFLGMRAKDFTTCP